MNKQETINEMADIISRRINGANFDDASDAANDLYKAGHRKIYRSGNFLGHNVLSDATLKGLKKEDLIEQIRILEHNWSAAEESLNIQAKNCEMLLKQKEKDTAKEIFKDFENAFSLYYPHGQIPYSVFQKVFEQLAKRKGVEVK